MGYYAGSSPAPKNAGIHKLASISASVQKDAAITKEWVGSWLIAN
jgi:hypothetical protein